MPTITIRRPQDRQNFGDTPYGNQSSFLFTLSTRTGGVVIGGDSATAPAVGDVIRIGALQAGQRLDDFMAVVSDAIEGLTGNLGFSYADGVNSATVPADAAYFGAVVLSSAARLRSTSSKAPVVLPKDAWLELTVTAAPTGVGRADIFVLGEQVGRA